MWSVSYLFAAPWGNHKGLPLLSKNKTWLHIQDYELDAAFALGFVKLKPLWRIVTLFERGYRVSTISERMMDRLKIKGVKPENTFLFPNWIDTETIYPLDRMGSTLAAHFSLSPDHFVALYSIIFVLCGDGAKRENLMNQAHSLKNIKWMPLQPIEKFNVRATTRDCP